MNDDIKELIAKCRLLEIDHEPAGWPAIRMRDVSALCDEVERQHEYWLSLPKLDSDEDRLCKRQTPASNHTVRELAEKISGLIIKS